MNVWRGAFTDHSHRFRFRIAVTLIGDYDVGFIYTQLHLLALRQIRFHLVAQIVSLEVFMVQNPVQIALLHARPALFGRALNGDEVESMDILTEGLDLPKILDAVKNDSVATRIPGHTQGFPSEVFSPVV
jgi:hypothetical protein